MARSVFFRMTEHDYLGLDLDEVLEGPEEAPCAVVADRESQVVAIPPLTDDQRAREVEIFELEYERVEQECKREREARKRARLLEDKAYWDARRASVSVSAIHELEEKDALQLSAAERALLILYKGPRWYMQRVAASATNRKATHGP